MLAGLQARGVYDILVVAFELRPDEMEAIARLGLGLDDEEEVKQRFEEPRYHVAFTRERNKNERVSGPALEALEQSQEYEIRYWIGEIQRYIENLEPSEMQQKHLESVGGLGHNDTRSWSQVVVDMMQNSDAATIFSQPSTKERKRIVNHVSSKITGEFGEYYHQSEVEIKLDIDGDHLQFYVYDINDALPFQLAQRSKGCQWFLSFYLTLQAASTTTSSHVILIDEPGVYLHPSAQQDMLRVLEQLARTHQIIFTTHSPYLINTKRLGAILLVLRKDGETVVENKIQSRADADTLKPVIAAIGYGYGQGIDLGCPFNVIIEGISDALYVQAFIRLFSPEKIHQVGVIGSVGASQVPNVALILLGWGR